MKIVYVAGPFRGPTPWDVEQNIRRAEALALEVWKLGAACLCPHTNTRFFDKAPDTPDDVYLEGDVEMLRRCDAVLMTPDWQRSTGARKEMTVALVNNIPVFHTLHELDVWLKAQ